MVALSQTLISQNKGSRERNGDKKDSRMGLHSVLTVVSVSDKITGERETTDTRIACLNDMP